MLKALLDCFKDESWPVRDCACLACGHFVSSFPEECKPVMHELTHLWFEHLSDNIQSVREHSAQALAGVLTKATIYREDLEKQLKDFITENLLKAKE